MTRREILASVIGAGIALVAAFAISPADRGAIAPAQAQLTSLTEQQRYLLFAVANAVASVAVDSERTAMALNEATDQLNVVKEQLRALEGRLAELEKKR